jgi:hypothetical protein
LHEHIFAVLQLQQLPRYLMFIDKFKNAIIFLSLAYSSHNYDERLLYNFVGICFVQGHTVQSPHPFLPYGQTVNYPQHSVVVFVVGGVGDQTGPPRFLSWNILDQSIV